jgi:uncharacterized cupredoxin-like copper-binding protein
VKKRSLSLFVILALTAVACGSSGDHAEHGGDGAEGGSHTATGEVPGVAGEPDEASQVVIVNASDDLRFDPSSLEVSPGETVTFVVHNVGKTDHEFVLGDPEYQEAHGEDMEDGGHDGDLGNAVSVAPGETQELTWRFDEEGEVLFGCHEPGHYEGGMVGTIQVS